MEGIVEEMQSMLFNVEVLLADPTNALQYGLNPSEATKRLGGLVGGAQEELLRRRELLSDWPGYPGDGDGDGEGGMPMDEWVDGWKELREVKKGEQEEMDDLVDVLGKWGNSTNTSSGGAMDTDMA